MIKGIGTDIVQLRRIEKALERSPKLLERILTPAELQQCHDNRQPARFFAKRFAAKEAVVKALGSGIGNGVSWQHIEISHNRLGKPQVVLTGGALVWAENMAVTGVMLSYSDEVDYVVAMAVAS